MRDRSLYSRCVILGGLILAASPAFSQLVPAGTPIPRTVMPPVVFLNGYQDSCDDSSFAGTFGIADQVLQANGEVSLFFNNCNVSGSPDIEALGAAFGVFLSNLQYDDGQPVDVVDCVAHSMGGLIVRSYLSGKQSASGAFQPVAVTHIRKVVFLATPHFGTGVTLPFLGKQADELASGSRFLVDLASWNQGTDDLRGVDAVTAIGNGGTGNATTKGFDDGVLALTSGSLDFYMPGRTRVVPFCHTDGGGILSLIGNCSFDAQGIAEIRSATEDPAVIMVSFLNGTSDWQNVGVAAEQDPFLSVDGGLLVTMRSADDVGLSIDSVTAETSTKTKDLNIPSNDVAYTDMFPSGPLTFTAASGSVHLSQPFTLPAGTYAAVVLKNGPLIARVFPAASSVFPLSVAPGMIVSIYGTSLAAETAQATAIPLPIELSDAQVLVSGTPVPLFYVSAIQINAIIPDGATSLAPLAVQNASGTRTINVFVEPAVPAIFTQDGSGKGAAAALNGNNQLVTPDNPLHQGDYLVLFLTGLGATTTRNGLDYANQQPTVTLSGLDCPVTYGGRAPGFLGLDQINCQVPSGLTSDPSTSVIVTSGIRTSNVAAVAVQ